MSISPDESIMELNVKPTNLNVEKAAYWNKGEMVPFLFMAKALDEISKESDPIIVRDILCNTLRTVLHTTPHDLVAVLYLLSDRVRPAHDNIDLSMGGEAAHLITLALAEILELDETKKTSFGVGEDLGLMANSIVLQKRSSSEPPLTVNKVLKTFRLIAEEFGNDRYEKKKNHIKTLLIAATDCEPQYLILMLERKLRAGLVHRMLLIALGHAALYYEKQSSPLIVIDPLELEKAAESVMKAYSVIPLYDVIVRAIINGGASCLPKACTLRPGIPCTAMEAKQTMGSVPDIISKFQDREFTCEFDYDGYRAMIHLAGSCLVEIYDICGQRNTMRFIKVCAAIVRLKKPEVESFIVDCKLVPYDREKGRILSLKDDINRQREKGANVEGEYCIYAFDILYLNGKQLLHDQLKDRRKHLYDSFQLEPGFLQFATAKELGECDQIQEFLDTAVESGSPGLILKTLTKDSTYEPMDKKGFADKWLRLRKDYVEKPSLYLVPVAAINMRNGVHAFVLACYDSGKKKFQTMGTIGPLVPDRVLQEHFERLKDTVIQTPLESYIYPETMRVDKWFQPTEVWEVKVRRLFMPPHKPGAEIGIEGLCKGILLQLPHFVRVVKEKKDSVSFLNDVSTPDTVKEMYEAQEAYY